MTTVTTFRDKIDRATKAGYSEDQIFEFISTQPEYSDKIARATKAGHKPKEIIQFLANTNVPYQAPQISTNPETMNANRVAQQLGAEDFTMDAELERLSDYGQTNFSKAALSGATIGLSEHVPGLKPEQEGIGTTFGRVVGSVLPIGRALSFGKWASKPLVALAQKTPIVGKQLGSLANLLGVGAVGGATYKGAEDLIQGKLPSPSEMLEEGAMWAAIDVALSGAGKLGQFTEALLKRSKQTGKPSFEVLNEAINQAKAEGIDIAQPDRVAAKALSILEAEAPAVTKESKALENVRKLETEFEVPKGRKTSESLDALGSHEPVDKIFGETVQKDINKSFKEAESKYTPLYQKVESQSKNIKYSDKPTIDLVQGMVRELNQVKTKAQNYDKVINTLKTVAEDLGYTVESNADGYLKLLDSAGKEVAPETKILYKNIPVSKGMELGRRLNQIVDYDLPEKTIRDKLKPVTRSVKAGIRKALGGRSKALETIFDRAEKLYGETAQKFGRDAVADIRNIQPTEKIIKIIDNPTSLDDLRKVLSPQDFNRVERRIIENYADKPLKDVQKAQKQLEPYLSDKGKKAFRDLAETKGYEALKEKLSPAVNKDGSINFEAFKELKKDSEFLKQVEAIGGPEAVEFVRNLDNYQRQIEKQIKQQADVLSRVQVKPVKEAVRGEAKIRNTKQRNKGTIDKIDAWLDNVGINKESKTVLKAALGIGAKIPIAAGSLGYKILTNLIRNKSNRTNYKRILSQTKPGNKPSTVKPTLTNLSLGLVKEKQVDKEANPSPKKKI